MQLLTTRQDLADTIQTVALDGTSYRVRLTWRGYCEAWYMDMTTADGTAILTGVRVEQNANLLLLSDAQELGPNGILLAVPTGTPGTPGTPSTVMCSVTGAATTCRVGHTFIDPAGYLWTPTATFTLPLAGTVRDAIFQTMDLGPVDLAAGAALTPQVPATAGLTVTALSPATPGAYHVETVREDLGQQIDLIFIPADEL